MASVFQKLITVQLKVKLVHSKPSDCTVISPYIPTAIRNSHSTKLPFLLFRMHSLCKIHDETIVYLWLSFKNLSLSFFPPDKVNINARGKINHLVKKKNSLQLSKLVPFSLPNCLFFFITIFSGKVTIINSRLQPDVCFQEWG